MIFFSALIGLLFILCNKKGQLNFDMETTAFLKAILPLFIIFHHAFISYADAGSLGVYVVALFFFISGYGLECKRLKNNELNTSMGGVKRFYRLILPTFIPIFLYLFSKWLIDGLSMEHVISQIKDYNLILPYSWFVIALFQLYILFYASLYLFRKHFLMMFSIVLTIYITILYCMEVQSTFYCSLYGFLCGILFIHILPYINRYAKYTWLALIGLIVVLSLIHIAPSLVSLYNTILFVTCAATLFSSIITPKSKVISFLTTHSYEIYLCQGIGFLISKEYFTDRFLIFMVTVLISVLVAVFCKKCTRALFGRLLA